MRISDWSSDVCSSDLELRAAGLLDDAPTVSGRSLFAEIDAAPTAVAGDDAHPVVLDYRQPLSARGGYSILYGALAPEGCIVKLAGHGRSSHAGAAGGVDSEEADLAAVTAGHHHPGGGR